MQFGLIALSLTGGTAVLARAALIVVMLCCLAVPVVSRMWSLRVKKVESDDAVDLDVLWERYRQGEISWDEYLRGKIEGRRGLVGTKAQEPPSKPTSNDAASS